MKRISLLMAAIGAAIATNSCDRSPTQEPVPAPPPGEGRLSLEVKTGAIGVLSRSATMTPRKVYFIFTSGTELVRKDSMSLLSGAQIARDFRLPAGKTYHLMISGYDTKDVVLYSGEADVRIGEDSTTNLSMALDARHSSMDLRIPVKDGAKRLQALLDGRPWMDTTLGSFVRENDTIKIQRDYVDASPTGFNHSLSLKISGNRGDKDTVLYALDTNLRVVSGQNQGLRLTLHWVGPTPPKYGMASITATLGAVGILSTDVAYGRSQEHGCREWQDNSGIPWNGTISYGILCDERDRQAYRTVRMGTQVWMAQDLNYAGADGKLGSCDIYLNPNCEFPRRVYTWTQATATPDTFLNAYWPGDTIRQQGICPAGWHIPQDREWRTLLKWSTTHAVGDLAQSLRAVDGWASDINHGTDQFGFHALPNRHTRDLFLTWSLNSAFYANPSQGSMIRINTVGGGDKTSELGLRCVQD